MTTPTGNGAPTLGSTNDSGRREENESLIAHLHSQLTLSGGSLESSLSQPLKAHPWLSTQTGQKVRVIRVWPSTLLIWTVGEPKPREVNRSMFETDIAEGLLQPMKVSVTNG